MATVAKVNHFILLTSLGTNKIGFPAAILNLFWGVLIWKRKAEVALIASGLPFTIVRPGGMERPTDAYKETHNIVLASEDTYFGGQVSNLQVAELMAFMAKSRDLSSYKVVEVIAETTAPLIPMEELLAKISSKHDSLLKKEQTVPKTKPTSPQTIESEPSIIAVEKEKVQTEVQKTSPLSPYVAYDDLKPLTSTPTPSSTPSAPKDSSVNAIEADSRPDAPPQISVLDPTSNGPLSPYIAYDDLKPPTSPTPTPSSTSSGRKEKPLNAVPPSSLSLQPEVVVSELKPTHTVEDLQVQNQKSRPLSPYYAYEDLKPPTSPSPNAPTVFSSNI